MAKTAPLVSFGLLLKARRLGFEPIENMIGDKPIYAGTHELTPTTGILKVYTQERFKKCREKSPKFIYVWWQCRESTSMLMEFIQTHREELETEGMLTLEFPVPPLPETM